jgi:flagellar motility protein MotE (MotC chaperone)
MPKYFSPRYLLPMMITVGVMVVFLRVDDIWEAATTGKFSGHPAQAASSAETKPATDTAKKDDKAADTTAASADAKKSDPDSASDTPRYEVEDSDRSAAEMQVLNQLSQRRIELDKRSKDLDTRDALMKVTEQRIDQKLKEMTTLRQQLQSMVNQAGEAQAAQLDNLVKIYETMKPDEAARIFETLDMPILLGVIQKMKPARTAPIMAKMAPEKAKEVTVALTKQDQLPQIK